MGIHVIDSYVDAARIAMQVHPPVALLLLVVPAVPLLPSLCQDNVLIAMEVVHPTASSSNALFLSPVPRHDNSRRRSC